MKKLIVLLVLAGLVTVVVVAIKWLGLWAIPVGLLLLVSLPFLFKFLFFRALERFMTGLFGAKGAVLRNAGAVIHGVSPGIADASAATESGHDEEEESREPSEYWMVEATITPSGSKESGFGLWEPGELRLVRPGADLKEDEDSLGHPTRIEVLQEDDSWAVDDGMKYAGEQRLRVLFAVAPGVRKVELAYYFERLATVELVGALSLSPS